MGGRGRGKGVGRGGVRGEISWNGAARRLVDGGSGAPCVEQREGVVRFEHREEEKDESHFFFRFL